MHSSRQVPFPVFSIAWYVIKGLLIVVAGKGGHDQAGDNSNPRRALLELMHHESTK